MRFCLCIIPKEKIFASSSIVFVRSCVYVVEHSTEISFQEHLMPKKRTYVTTLSSSFHLYNSLSTRRKFFLCVTVHWPNNDLKRKSACLDIRRVVGKCDYEVLSKLLQSIHKEFEITAKIPATVTDSGSNFVKVFPIFATNTTISTSSNDDPQQLSDVMDQATSAYSSDLSDSEFEEEDSEYSNRVQEDSGIQEEIREMEEQQIEEFLAITNILDQKISDVICSFSSYRRCASHTLNLIATRRLCYIYKNMGALLKDLKESTE